MTGHAGIQSAASAARAQGQENGCLWLIGARRLGRLNRSINT